MDMRNLSKAALAVLFGLLWCPSVHAAAELELSFSSGYSPAQTQTAEIVTPWAESFPEKSGGAMAVHVFPFGSHTHMDEVGHAIRDGSLDMGVWYATFPKEAPFLQLFNLPFMMKSSRHGTALLYSLYEQIPEFRNEADSVGVLLTMWSSAKAGICSVNAPIRSPGDIRGKRILITSPYDAPTIEAWGGIPVFLDPTDVYVGLQRGMGEAYYNAIPFQKGLRLNEVARFITPLPAKAVAHYLSINRDLYADLSPAEKTVLHDLCNRELGEKYADSLDRDVDAVLQLFRDSGAQVMLLTPEEEKAFQAAVDPILSSYWEPRFQEIGLPGDIQAWIAKAYEISHSLPDPDAR